MWVREDKHKSWAVEQFKRGIKKLLASHTESLGKHGVRNTYPPGTVPMGSSVNRRGGRGSFTLCLFKWLWNDAQTKSYSKNQSSLYMGLLTSLSSLISRCSISCLHQLVFQSNRDHRRRAKSSTLSSTVETWREALKIMRFGKCLQTSVTATSNGNTAGRPLVQESGNCGAQPCLVHFTAQWSWTSHNFICKMRFTVTTSQIMLESKWNIMSGFHPRWLAYSMRSINTVFPLLWGSIPTPFQGK